MNAEIEEIDREWHSLEETGNKAIKVYISGRTGYILLAKDRRVQNMWDVHFINFWEINDQEKEILAKEVIKFLKPGEYLGVCGKYEDNIDIYYKLFSYRFGIFEDTKMVRVLKKDQNPIYFPILKKN